MYAVVDIKGFQYKLSEGDTLKVPKYDLEVGAKVTIPEVLLVSGEAGVQVGTPTIEGAAVQATVVGQGKYDKVVIFKKKRRKDSFAKTGHRQEYTELKIDAIAVSGSAS